MKPYLALLATLFALTLASIAAGTAGTQPAQAASVGALISGHSHWDDPNADYEIRFCLLSIARTATAGTEIAFIPFREHDAKNFEQLTLTTTGLRLTHRINGVTTVVTPLVYVKQNWGAGSEIMIDFKAIGSYFYAYIATSLTTDGQLIGEWHDTTYSRGVNYSYYSPPGNYNEWENVFGTPLDSIGRGHTIHGLYQDARSHKSLSGEQTFDDVTHGAGGTVNGITNANGSTQTFGLPQSADYTLNVSVGGSGSGHLDYHDTETADGKFFGTGFYRMTAGSQAAIQKYNGSGTASTKWALPCGGAGSYTITQTGATTTFSKDGVAGCSKTWTDAWTANAARIRVVPSTQTWSFTGTVNP